MPVPAISTATASHGGDLLCRVALLPLPAEQPRCRRTPRRAGDSGLLLLPSEFSRSSATSRTTSSFDVISFRLISIASYSVRGFTRGRADRKGCAREIRHGSVHGRISFSIPADTVTVTKPPRITPGRPDSSPRPSRSAGSGAARSRGSECEGPPGRAAAAEWHWASGSRSRFPARAPEHRSSAK